MDENRKAFKVPPEKHIDFLKEQMKKYGPDAHKNGVCPKTGRPYESKSNWDGVPGIIAPIGGPRYCSECGISLPC
jgi:hypothetical protein